MVALRSDDGEIWRDRGISGRVPLNRRPPRAARHGGDDLTDPVRGGVGPRTAVLVVVALLLGGAWLTGEGDGSRAVAASAEPQALRSPAGAPATSETGVVHLVQPGESYWTIAVELEGPSSGDVRPRVDALQAANGSRPLRAGDRLVVTGPPS